MDDLTATDPEVDALVHAEERRQHDTLTLIASENHASAAVLRAVGSVFSNKYSEGYPGRRYYEGQQCVDPLETLAIERAKDLFGVEHANVQPYSGSPANLAIMLAFLDPGDTLMGLGLPMGGHLTHGWNVSVSGKWFRSVQYTVRRDTGVVDLDEVRELALKERPKLLFCGGTAIPRIVDFEGFARIAQEAGAILVADMAHIAGLVAGGVHPSPVGHADVISTTTHKTLRGPRGAMLMGATEEQGKALDRAVFPGLQGGPHNNTTAGIAVALREASTPEFAAYARRIVDNSQALSEALIERGFDLVSGGSDNHLILVDLTNRDIGGKPVAQALDRAGITANYNTVPFDTRKPFDPSGLRLGTAAVTTRGLGTGEMEQLADWIAQVVDATSRSDEGEVEVVRKQVVEFAQGWPVPGIEAGAPAVSAS